LAEEKVLFSNDFAARGQFRWKEARFHVRISKYPDISLIVCSRNRCHQLTRCLESICQITWDREWELVIVDNGSTDGTSAMVQEFVRTASIDAVYLREPEPGKSNGLNAALKIARAEIVAFTDDDCYPAPDFMARTWSAFVDSSVGYITGRIMLHDPTDYAMTINESTQPLQFPGGQYLRPGAVMGANMAFRRSVLLDIGGFDPMFGPGTPYVVEDHDVAVRAGAMGWNGLYCPEVVVRHHHGRKKSDVRRSVKLYGMGLGAHHMKLLLTHKQYALFASAVLDFGHRWAGSKRYVLWEVVGALRYLGSLLAPRRPRAGRKSTKTGGPSGSVAVRD
jgi:cellulose synthase/poly-beta-1,6-N-acetylglucosamine synthase-like glycosyltransferase